MHRGRFIFVYFLLVWDKELVPGNEIESLESIVNQVKMEMYFQRKVKMIKV